MPGSKHYVPLDRRTLEAYLMGVVRRFNEVAASVWRLSDRRSELWVSTSVTLAVSSMAMMSKEQWLTQKACYHACKSSCRVAAAGGDHCRFLGFISAVLSHFTHCQLVCVLFISRGPFRSV